MPDARDGRTPETAWHACFDTRSDYRRVAEYRCADGSMPLGGDVRAGGAARRGNIGAGPDGHILDLYDVPCPEGAVPIHVDGYHCEEELAPLSEPEIQQAMSDLRRYVHSPEDMSLAVVTRGTRLAQQLGITYPECRHLYELLIPSEAEVAEWRFLVSIYLSAQLVGLFELRADYQRAVDPTIFRAIQMEKVRAAAVTYVTTYQRLIMAGYGALQSARLDRLAALPSAELEEVIDESINMCNLEAMLPGMRVERREPTP